MISYFDSRSDNKPMVRWVPSEIFSSDKSAITEGKDKETEIKRREITEAYKSNKDKVVQKLLDRVVLVQPELHRNLKKRES